MFWKGFYIPVTVILSIVLFGGFVYCYLYGFTQNLIGPLLYFFPVFILVILLEWILFQHRMEQYLEERYRERDKRIRIFWSYCRHGLRNHLQMISLLAQMKYYERMISYINKVSAELNEWNKMLQIEHPEIALFLLHQKYNLELGTTFNLDTDLSRLAPAPEKVIACLNSTVQEIEEFCTNNPALKINVEENEEGYSFVLYNLVDSGGFLSSNAVKRLNSQVKKTGGTFNCKHYPGNLWVINLTFPCTEPEEESLNLDSQKMEWKGAGGLYSVGR